MKDTDVSFRVNLITLEPSASGEYDDFIIKDHSAGDITTEEADQLLECIREAFSKENISLYTGLSIATA